MRIFTKKLMVVGFILFCSMAYANQSFENSQTSIMNLLKSKEVKKVTKALDTIKSNPSFYCSEEIRTQIADVFIEGNMCYEEVAEVLRTITLKCEKARYYNAYLSPVFKDLKERLKSDDNDTFQTGLNDLLKILSIKGNDLYLSAGISVEPDNNIIRQVDKYLDKKNKVKGAELIIAQFLWQFDPALYEHRIKYFLSLNDNVITKFVLTTMRSKIEIIKKHSNELIDLIHSDREKEIRNIAIDLLLETRDSNNLTQIENNFVSITNIVNSVLKAYAEHDVKALFEVSDSNFGFFVVNQIYNNTREVLYPNKTDSKRGAIGSFDDVKKFLEGESCLSVDRVSNIKIYSGNILNIKDEYYINEDFNDTTDSWIKENYYPEKNLSEKNVNFTIAFQIKSSIPYNLQSCNNECILVNCRIVQGTPFIAGIIGIDLVKN